MQQISTAAPGLDHKVIDPIKVMMGGWKMILSIGGVLFGILGGLATTQQSPYYESTGQVRISPVIPALLGNSEDQSITGYYNDHIRTELEKLQHSDLLENLVNDPQGRPAPTELISLLPNSILARESWYQRHVEVRQVPRTQLLEILIRNEQPTHLHDLVNALLEQYLEATRREEEEKDLRRLDYLLEVKLVLSENREILQTQLIQLAQTMGTGTFEQGYWLKRETLAESQKALARANSALISSLAKRERASRESTITANIDLSGIIEDRLSRDDSLWNTEFWTYRQLQNMRSSIDGITPENPDRIYIDQRMENSKDYLDTVVRDAKDRATRIENMLRQLKIDERWVEADQTVLESLKVSERLELETQALENAARSSAGNMILARSWQKELEHQSEMEFKLNDRIHELKLNAKAPDRVTIAKRASMAVDPAGTNLKKLLMMAAFASFGLVGAILYILALKDRLIRSPQHIEMACGNLPSWPISRYDHPESFHHIVKNGNNHPAARAIRSLSFRIMRLEQLHRPVRLCFTGVHSGSGVTSVALNVAQTMASTGSRVVVISVDPHQTSHQELIPNFQPLSQLPPEGFDGFLDPDTEIEYLWPKGDALRYGDRLFSHYENSKDTLIFDCPPLLLSDATEAVAGKSDLSLLVVQGDVTRYDLLRRCFTILWRMGLQNTIPVLNWGGKEVA
jgi:polysaccharide biosynthesis transport protein